MSAPETVTERVTVVVHGLTLGKSMTIGDVMALTGLTRSGAYTLMNRVSRVAPLVLDAGRWQLLQHVHRASTGG